MKRHATTALALTLAIACGLASAAPRSAKSDAALSEVCGRVVRVADGDTLTILDAEKYKGSLPGFVRSLVDIDEDAVQEKFGEFLSGGTLNHEQQEFVREIIDYLRENGEVTAEDLTNDEPFANYDITNLFADRMDQLRELLKRISDIDTWSAA